MNILIKKNISKKAFSIVFLILTLSTFSQKVYKVEDLLTRIYNSSDTVYVVNFWATWCKPCVAELPEFEKINQKYKSEKVKIILVSMDFKEDLLVKVIPFLEKNKYTSEVILLDETGGDFINKITSKWSGALPATIITKDNQKVFVFYEKKVTEEILKSEIEQANK